MLWRVLLLLRGVVMSVRGDNGRGWGLGGRWREAPDIVQFIKCPKVQREVEVRSH
jgi:hypothetical protein